MTGLREGHGRRSDSSPDAGHRDDGAAGSDDHDGPAGIHSVAPPGCSAVDSTAPGSAADLVGPEHDETASMVPSRLAEYAAARRCGHLALDRLGVPHVGIPRGGRGQPVWPAGVVGSLTHCDGYAAALVADGRDLAAVGIDAEPHEPLPPEVLEHISRPQEVERLAALSAVSPGIAWDRILFCVKEALFKTLSAQDQHRFRPAEVQVRLDPCGAVGVVSPGVSGSPGDLWSDADTPRHGWWAVDRGRVVVCVVLEHGRRGAARCSEAAHAGHLASDALESDTRLTR